MMLKSFKFAALVTAGLLASQLAIAEEKAVATVNGVAIPQSRMDMRIKFIVTQSQGQQADTPELRKRVAEELVDLELLSQAAVKKGFDKQPDTVQQLELARQSTLAGAYVEDYVKNHPISEDALKKEYEGVKGKPGAVEYKVAHILVKTENEANAIEAQLKKGAKFDTLAKQKSQDPISKTHGGDMGWNVPSNFVQPFAAALASLKKGEVSAPVQTQYGWHIIKLEDQRDVPFEQLKPSLLNYLRNQSVQKAIAELKASAKIQ